MKTEIKKLVPIREVFGVKVFDIGNIKDFPETYVEIIKNANKAFKVENSQDEYDDYYSWLVSYEEKNNEIISCYRYLVVDENSIYKLSNSEYYDFYHCFVHDVLSSSIGLGRSFVNHDSKLIHENPKAGLYAAWKGLGALVHKYHDLGDKRYLLGQVSLQVSLYNEEQLAMIVAMLQKNFPLVEGVYPKMAYLYELGDLPTDLYVGNYSADEKILRRYLIDNNCKIPTLLLSYCQLGVNGGLSTSLVVKNNLLGCYEILFVFDLSKLPANYKKRFVGE
jgi:hypothetical protein